MVRLDQFIATSTALSRKDAKRAISSGRVQVDGNVCKTPNTKLPPEAEVTLDGQACTLPGERYLMLNKPAGVVSATRDSDHPTALDLLPRELSGNLHIAGRLDADTTGLLLLTTDGQWSHRITSPRVDCPKTYLVTLSDDLSEPAVRELQQGVSLRNDPQPTRPAGVRVLEPRLIELTLSEGRYHQVKRMLAAVGNHVEALHRLRIGAITLDSELEPGQFRALTPEEIGSVD
ncbi:16S rRNA pseudouridine(516) synthase RsuA [Marinobacter sp. F4206]|uniref:16S rRNA pseudouridine(516) synthase RsuA n=1 Tax=Marinobacter sp. F4206 TaxID=2861777 RepID=UPI001C5F52C6|nr:16S rRNA pseudouridine(516) synthase RsuA [Marinobacter sp. F4206]MBW4934703.1 16S rRNA pseudouridine(516) synthase RsuA [Marinobacter sp. F4206]